MTQEFIQPEEQPLNENRLDLVSSSLYDVSSPEYFALNSLAQAGKNPSDIWIVNFSENIDPEVFKNTARPDLGTPKRDFFIVDSNENAQSPTLLRVLIYDEKTNALVVSPISKSELATNLAEKLKASFPDGQQYVEYQREQRLSNKIKPFLVPAAIGVTIVSGISLLGMYLSKPTPVESLNLPPEVSLTNVDIAKRSLNEFNLKLQQTKTSFEQTGKASSKITNSDLISLKDYMVNQEPTVAIRALQIYEDLVKSYKKSEGLLFSDTNITPSTVFGFIGKPEQVLRQVEIKTSSSEVKNRSIAIRQRLLE